MSDITLIDIAALTAPLSEAAPCGDNLEYDPQFQALEQAARGKPEVEYGSTLTPATPPDWIEVRTLALQLMDRCRDLRVAMTLTRALLKLEGVPGLAAGLALLAELLTRQWDHVHPQLDPDDDNDPMLRVNVLASLCQSGALLRDLRDAPLAQVRALGSVSLRDIEQAAGERESEEDGRKSMLDAVFSAAAQEQLAQMVAALEQALATAQRIEQELTARVGVGSALDMEPLTTVLRRAADAVRPHLRAVPAVVDAAPEQGAEAAQSGAVAAPRPAGEISSRADIQRLLDKMCTYYAEHEPGSPVPALLRRAARLVDMSFAELLQELAPDGLNQYAQVSGVRNEN